MMPWRLRFLGSVRVGFSIFNSPEYPLIQRDPGGAGKQLELLCLLHPAEPQQEWLPQYHIDIISLPLTCLGQPLGQL